MADDKMKQGGSDRARVAAGEPYEVEYFARMHGLSRQEAERLIREIGNDQAQLDAAAEKQTTEAPLRAERSCRALKTDTMAKPEQG
jgi:hypothetical protein